MSDSVEKLQCRLEMISVVSHSGPVDHRSYWAVYSVYYGEPTQYKEPLAFFRYHGDDMSYVNWQNEVEDVG